MDLRPYQIRAGNAILRVNAGILKAPPRSGKTIIMAWALSQWLGAIKWLGKRARVTWIANTREQIAQGEKACAEFPIIAKRANIRFVCYAGAPDCSGDNLVIADEVHHLSAPEFRKCLDGFTGVRWGMSATPEREDELSKDVFELIGPIVFEITREELLGAGHLAHAVVEFHQPNTENELLREITDRGDALNKKWAFGANTGSRTLYRLPISRLIYKRPKTEANYILSLPGCSPKIPAIALCRNLNQEQKTKLSEIIRQFALDDIEARARWIACQEIGVFGNQKRNAQIIWQARQHAADSTLLLVGSIAHGEFLQSNIQGSKLCHSKMGAKLRRETIAAFKDGAIRCIIATSLADEGIDLPIANVMIMAMAGRSSIKVEQRSARVLTAFAGKANGVIHDFFDAAHPFLLSQSKARLKIYRSLGYEIREAQQELGV